MLDVKSFSTSTVIQSAQMPTGERKQRPDEDTVFIDEKDRQDIEARMKVKKVNKRQLAIACDVSASAITLLLSKPIPEGDTRGCRFMSKLQKTLDLVITAKRPTVQPTEISRRAERIMKLLKDDPEELEHWLTEGEWRAGRKGST